MTRHLLLVTLWLIAGCKTVVTSTTEVRPSRYAAVEFATATPPDSFVSYAKRAVVSEGLKVQREDKIARTVTAGPIWLAASTAEPALEAVIAISLEPRGSENWIRVLASAVLEQGQIGGQDARLAELVRRIRQRIETMTGS